MTIICVDPRNDPLWSTLVNQHPSSAFHSPAWMRVLAETYDFDIFAYVVVNRAGLPTAGFPFCRLADIRGERVVSLPFSDYCDPIVGDRNQWDALVGRLQLEQSPIIMRCLHNQLPVRDERFTLVNRAKWHGLNLQPDLDTLWQSLHSSARRAVKKAQKQGVRVRLARDEPALRAFFELHLSVRKHKYHLLAQPYQFFKNIWHHFIQQGYGLLMTAEYEGTLIGGILFLEWQRRLYYKFNASSPAYLQHRPNDLMIWEAIKYAKEQGYTQMDFGLSDWDQEPLIRFKRKFASDEKAIYFLQYAPNGGPSRHEAQVRVLLPQLTDLFTDDSVPDGVTEKAGELLYRYFC